MQISNSLCEIINHISWTVPPINRWVRIANCLTGHHGLIVCDLWWSYPRNFNNYSRVCVRERQCEQKINLCRINSLTYMAQKPRNIWSNFHQCWWDLSYSSLYHKMLLQSQSGYQCHWCQFDRHPRVLLSCFSIWWSVWVLQQLSLELWKCHPDLQYDLLRVEGFE